MAQTIMKYNPAFLKPEELVASFVVRHGELETIMRIIKENITKSNQHILVIGPRGIGKTMLVLRAAEEVKRDDQLNKKWYPLVFSEESYSVVTCGEFWLESLFHLAHQTEDQCWQKTYEELLEEKDEKRLRERALAQLMDFADKQGKRILLVAENLNMLLGDQMNDDEAWALRHTLLNEPRVMLLASATSRFEQVDVEGKPMFELFRFLELKPLNKVECRALWAFVTGNKPDDARVRPLEILTGGNPRLMAIVSNFAAKMSLKNLMNDLMQLVDEHTEYFKSHLDNLPPIERKVYIALAEIWDPATARQVGESARLNVSKTSSLLARLMERGAVVEANGKGKAKIYQLAERMYNIYYLMRKRGEASQRIRAVVNFMTSFYAAEELVGIVKSIAEEACQLAPTERGDHYAAYEGVLNKVKGDEVWKKIVSCTPLSFFEGPDVPVYLQKLLNYVKETEEMGIMLEIVDKCKQIRKNPKELEKKESDLRARVSSMPQNYLGWAAIGILLHFCSDRYEEAEKAYREAIRIKPNDSLSWGFLGVLLGRRLGRYKEAELAWRKAIEINPNSTEEWEELGSTLMQDGKLEEAEKALRKALSLNKKSSSAHVSLGYILLLKRRFSEGEKCFWEAIKYDPENIHAASYLIILLLNDSSRQEEGRKFWADFVKNAETARKNIERASNLFVDLAGVGYQREALEILRESAWAEVLEPVVVALRLMAGEDVKVAAEIMEVAKDVVKRIEETKKQIESAKKDEEKK